MVRTRDADERGWSPLNEDWELLLSFLPSDWQGLAHDAGALKGLRKDKSAENLLRTLLIHLGCGHSLRETVVRAKKANLADLSDVALLKRLRKSKDWLRALCLQLFREQGVAVSADGGFQIRAFDATTVQEPGKTGALWRIHYRAPRKTGHEAGKMGKARYLRREPHNIFGLCPDPKGSSSPEITIPVVPGSPLGVRKRPHRMP